MPLQQICGSFNDGHYTYTACPYRSIVQTENQSNGVCDFILVIHILVFGVIILNHQINNMKFDSFSPMVILVQVILKDKQKYKFVYSFNNSLLLHVMNLL